jgi:hypothetical protein
MVQILTGRYFTMKTLIRIAFAALSLSGMAHAEPANGDAANKVSPKTGGYYNFTAGGGG